MQTSPEKVKKKKKVISTHITGVTITKKVEQKILTHNLLVIIMLLKIESIL